MWVRATEETIRSHSLSCKVVLINNDMQSLFLGILQNYCNFLQKIESFSF
jgi:hypothetical protein